MAETIRRKIVWNTVGPKAIQMAKQHLQSKIIHTQIGEEIVMYCYQSITAHEDEVIKAISKMSIQCKKYNINDFIDNLLTFNDEECANLMKTSPYLLSLYFGKVKDLFHLFRKKDEPAKIDFITPFEKKGVIK